MHDRVPIGKPLNLSDDDLEEQAKVTPEDIEAARKLWRESVDPEIADLLDATETVE